MSVAPSFNKTAAAPRLSAKRPAPFSIRLSDTDRARLALEAAGAPLGAYIKSKLLDGMPAGRKRRKVLTIEDREALARALALLGRSDLLRSLQDMARAAEIGALVITPETEAELHDAIVAVQDIRSAILEALGHRNGGWA
ncbi:hypothetical protein ABIE28_003622 [Devosia sp. 2618]